METENKLNWKAEIMAWVESFAVGLALVWLLHTFVAEPFIVEGASMNPTLQTQERVVVSKFPYWFEEPQKNDVIVFEFQRDPSRNFIKRVIATGGDTIEITGGTVYVNDQPLKEDYIKETTRTEYPKTVVPEGTVFAMGDNRNNSLDSRFEDVGFIKLDAIKGKANVVMWPLAAMKLL